MFYKSEWFPHTYIQIQTYFIMMVEMLKLSANTKTNLKSIKYVICTKRPKATTYMGGETQTYTISIYSKAV